MTATPLFIDALYGELLARGIEYFFPGSRLAPIGTTRPSRPALVCRQTPDDTFELDWLGVRYVLRTGTPFTESQSRLLHSIGRVLSVRYQLLSNPALAAENLHLFRGLPEDRFVSAFLDPSPWRDVEQLAGAVDRISEAIEVLRVSALTT